MKSDHKNRRTILDRLEARTADATGPSHELDQLIAITLMHGKNGEPIPEFSSSVDACLSLIGELLPNWHWHVGHGPDGILPYAALRKEAGAAGIELTVEASASTVPLALLHATVKALLAEQP